MGAKGPELPVLGQLVSCLTDARLCPAQRAGPLLPQLGTQHKSQALRFTSKENRRWVPVRTHHPAHSHRDSLEGRKWKLVSLTPLLCSFYL